MVLFFAHIPFVVKRTFNATPTERLQQYSGGCPCSNGTKPCMLPSSDAVHHGNCVRCPGFMRMNFSSKVSPTAQANQNNCYPNSTVPAVFISLHLSKPAASLFCHKARFMWNIFISIIVGSPFAKSECFVFFWNQWKDFHRTSQCNSEACILQQKKFVSDVTIRVFAAVRNSTIVIFLMFTRKYHKQILRVGCDGVDEHSDALVLESSICVSF